FGGLFGQRAQPRASRPRRGNDLETETQLDFVEACKGVSVPLRLTSPAPCTTCHGSGARPGTSPKVCGSCNGSGVINRNQGAFGFSEPCADCRGTGSIIENPCTDCQGTGVTTRTRTITVRIPPGVDDGQRIRLAGQGEAGLRGAPSGDLYVTVHVRPDKVFTRDGDDLTLTVPRAGGNGDLLVTVKVAVPSKLEDSALEALQRYQVAEKASGGTPRRRQPERGARTFLISVAAELAGMHAQTLRTYDRLGLVSPERTTGGGRRYSQRDVD
ncbi:Chaperone protein DnaJ 1, partial [Aduncisulcus paluster]